MSRPTAGRRVAPTTAAAQPAPVLVETPRWLAAWMGLAVALGVVAPTAALVGFGRDAAVRRALVPYLGLLAAQVAVETAAARRLPPWTASITGTACTVLRLRQLGRASGDLAEAPASTGRTAASAVVLAGRVFWTANLAAIAVHTPALVSAGGGARLLGASRA